jgi:hypothetical protein
VGQSAAGATEGYLTVKTGKTFITDPYERRYFTVRDTKVFYYNDKRSFQLHPAKPINSRPIDLEGYALVAGGAEAPYNIVLVPTDPENDTRTSWKFRCDTISEFNRWVQIFQDALSRCRQRDSTAGSTAGEFAVLTGETPLNINSAVANNASSGRAVANLSNK